MFVHRAYRYELDPTQQQRQDFARACGTARFAFNRGLADRIERFQKNEGKAKFTTAFDQMHDIVNLKNTEEFSWLQEIDSYVPRYSLMALDRAFKNFWKGRKDKRKVGFPRFKRRGVKDAFTCHGLGVRVLESRVKLPKIGSIRTKERTAVAGRILFATVRREADRWYASITVEQEVEDPKPVVGPVVGIDLGVKTFATVSDGTTVQAPVRLERLAAKVPLLSRRVSRKQKGSKNRQKAVLRLARLHRRIRNTRSNFVHEFTTGLAKTKQTVVIEDLSVKDMVSKTSAHSRSLNRKILAAAFSEVRRQLEYKTIWYGSKLVVADRYFPSSQVCSGCGHQQPMPLEVRTYCCPSCGSRLDRDLNAAVNLARCTTMPVGNYACGDEKFMVDRKIHQVLVGEAGILPEIGG